MHRRWYPSEHLSLVVSADFSEASNSIYGIWLQKHEQIPDEEDERWFHTPLQVADAGHRYQRALDLVKNLPQ
jgi:hypothetical protein